MVEVVKEMNLFALLLISDRTAICRHDFFFIKLREASAIVF